MWRWCLVILVGLTVPGCHGSSPTEPPPLASLTGTWTGTLASYPFEEDWSSVRLVLTSTGGTFTSANGITHPVTIARESFGTVLTIEQLPQNVPCRVALVVTRVTLTEMHGNLSGRCPNTLLGPFQLSRL